MNGDQKPPGDTAIDHIVKAVSHGGDALAAVFKDSIPKVLVALFAFLCAASLIVGLVAEHDNTTNAQQLVSIATSLAIVAGDASYAKAKAEDAKSQAADARSVAELKIYQVNLLRSCEQSKACDVKKVLAQILEGEKHERR